MALSAFGYQRELLAQYDYRNKINACLMSWLMHQGAEIVATGTVEGPYTKHTTYFLSDGTSWTQVSASPLPAIVPIRFDL